MKECNINTYLSNNINSDGTKYILLLTFNGILELDRSHIHLTEVKGKTRNRGGKAKLQTLGDKIGMRLCFKLRRQIVISFANYTTTGCISSYLTHITNVQYIKLLIDAILLC